MLLLLSQVLLILFNEMKAKDKKRIEKLRNRDNYEAAKFLSKNRKVFAAFVESLNGSRFEVDDMLQEGIEALLNKIDETENESIIKNLDGYFFTICKNILYKRMQREGFEISCENEKLESLYIPVEDTTERDKIENENLKLYEKIFNDLTKECRDVLFQKFIINKGTDMSGLLLIDFNASTRTKLSRCRKEARKRLEKFRRKWKK